MLFNPNQMALLFNPNRIALLFNSNQIASLFNRNQMALLPHPFDLLFNGFAIQPKLIGSVTTIATQPQTKSPCYSIQTKWLCYHMALLFNPNQIVLLFNPNQMALLPHLFAAQGYFKFHSMLPPPYFECEIPSVFESSRPTQMQSFLCIFSWIL
jgi:hypothetical protein